MGVGNDRALPQSVASTLKALPGDLGQRCSQILAALLQKGGVGLQGQGEDLGGQRRAWGPSELPHGTRLAWKTQEMSTGTTLVLTMALWELARGSSLSPV